MLRKVIIICYLLQILNGKDAMHEDSFPAFGRNTLVQTHLGGLTEPADRPNDLIAGYSGAIMSTDRPGNVVPTLTEAAHATGQSTGRQLGRKCLTGSVTDVQGWVDEFGNLRPTLDARYLIDVSTSEDPILSLRQQIGGYSKKKTIEVKHLSMSKCNLTRVPTVFQLRDLRGRALFSTVQYLTFYGNDFTSSTLVGVAFDEIMNASQPMQFNDVDARWPGPSIWASGFNHVTFAKLKELDLRRCNIQQLNDDIFIGMPKLEALYLSENHITFISVKAFNGLYSLIRLDLSRNFDGISEVKGIKFQHWNVFDDLRNLNSLDFSMTLLFQHDIDIFLGIRNVTRLSVCYSGLTTFPRGIFAQSSIRVLDVSGNNGILSRKQPLFGLEHVLTVLYAKEVGLKNFNVFKRFEKLEVLDISSNEIGVIDKDATQTLFSLQIINLNNNRLTSWFEMIFSYIKNLKLLTLRENNINLISPEMIEDIQNVTYLGLAGNFIVCNCHTRELFEVAFRNEHKIKPSPLLPISRQNRSFSYHTGFVDFNNVIGARTNLTFICKRQQECERNDDKIDSEGNFLLIDYGEHLSYQCLNVAKSETIAFAQMKTCPQARKDEYLDVINESKTKLLVIIVIPVLIFPILIFCYIFRRNLKYFWITVRNSATLSMITKNEIINDGTLFNYDVFVSYCNEDRDWVLDELLPNVEKGCNISVCLHERDFQVGLSILENIVSCMDRSRSIMLIISKQFLMSQWCQFEMHLAQHRLLETRREDLILVLLEDLPRRLRPTTLHYLMMTKTYIVWPKKSNEQPAFWKRLSRSILARRQVSQENFSLA